MKKLYFTLILTVFFSLYINSQSLVNYDFSTTQSAILEDMSSSTTQLIGPSTHDVASATTDIGFSFNFMGTPYTQFSVNSNGQLSLGFTLISRTGINEAAFNTPLIVPISGGNAILSTGKVHFTVKGTPPNRILIVEWKDLNIPNPVVDNNPPISEYNPSQIQVYLYETTGLIEFKYGKVSNNSVQSITKSTFISSSNTANTVKYVGSDIISAINSSIVGTYAFNSTNINLLNQRSYSFSPLLPSAPTVTVFDNCDGSSTLTASDYTGTLLWSTLETTPSITVSIAGIYTVIQTVAGFASLEGSGTALPKTIPVDPAIVSITSIVTNVCMGTPVNFTAIPVRGGALPIYQWYKNSLVVGTTASFTCIPENGDVVYLVMTSSLPCVRNSSAVSNIITMIVNPIIQAKISLEVSSNPVTPGSPVTFEAIPQGGGTSPVYKWFKNNSVISNTGIEYIYSPANNDEVYVEMTSNASPCLLGSPIKSITIKMSVSPGTSITQNGANVISIYATGKNIFVNCVEEAKQIFIYNSLGLLIKSDSNVNGLKNFDMNNKPNAYYVVKVITQYSVYTEKVLIK